MEKDLKKYLDAAGVSGFEKEAFDVMKNHIGNDCDELIQDNIGSLIAVKKTDDNKPRVMVAGHLDEIGMMVTSIDENGFIKFQTLGGWWNQNMLAQRVELVNDEGKRFLGVIGSKPPHALSPAERTKPMDIKNMYIDIGVDSKEEAEKLNISIGNFIVPFGKFEAFGDKKHLVGKAFDNRIGCYISAEVLKRLYKETLDVNLYAVGTVQEEVGLRGARTASNVVKPDLAISVDIRIASDTPGHESISPSTKLGDGPLITMFDASMIGHRELIKHVKKVASDNKIPFQNHSISFGGTDAGAMHISNNGAPGIYIGIATRYGHSSTEVIHKSDVENTIKLVVAVIKSLNADVIKEITYN